MRVDSTYGRVILAGPYFAAVDAIGSSPADSPAAILGEPRGARAAADRLLLRAGDLTVAAVAAPEGAALRRRCLTARSAGTPIRSLVGWLPPSGISIFAATGGTAVVRALRFAVAFATPPLASVPPGRHIVVRALADRSSTPWQLQISSTAAARICAVS